MNDSIPSHDRLVMSPSHHRFISIASPRLASSLQGVGEPPFFLSTSAFFAIKHAVAAARKDHGEEGYFPFMSPATSERCEIETWARRRNSGMLSTGELWFGRIKCSGTSERSEGNEGWSSLDKNKESPTPSVLMVVARYMASLSMHFSK